VQNTTEKAMHDVMQKVVFKMAKPADCVDKDSDFRNKEGKREIAEIEGKL